MRITVDLTLPRLPRWVALLLVTGLLVLPASVVLASHQFSDVPTSDPFHGDIDALVDAAITAGCGGGKYCPTKNVTRDQMAAFMNRLGALGPGKKPVVHAATALTANSATTASNAGQLDGLDSTAFLSGYEVVVETQSATGHSGSGVSLNTLDCPTGKLPIAGGYHDPTLDPPTDFAPIGQEGPVSAWPTATGWSFLWVTTATHNVDFYVICIAAGE